MNPEESFPVDVAEAMRRGEKIEAIKLLREKTGMGLAEAKAAVERFQDRTRAAPGTGAPGEAPRANRYAWLLAVALLVLVGWFFLHPPG